MAEFEYPYIPKNYYPAVMFACSCIRKYGTFNVACRAAAKKYNLDEDEIAKHVRARQSAGQKKAAKKTTRKYWYFAFICFRDYWVNDYDVDILFSEYWPEKWKEERKRIGTIIRSTSYENAEKKLPHGELDRDFRMTGERFEIQKWKKFETLQDAEKWMNESCPEWRQR